MSAVPSLRGRASRSVVWVCGLAAGAMGCAAPNFDRERVLVDRLDRLGAARPRPSTSNSDSTGADLFEGAGELERERLIETVLARNPSLEAARQAFRAALARPAQERSLDDPMLGLGAAPLSFASRRVDPAGRIDLSQRLPFPGKLRLRGEAALAEADAVAGDFESLRLTLALAASKLFDDHRLAARALAINREHVALLEELQAVALARYAAGEDSKANVLTAELAHARALYEANALEREARLVVARLNALLHRPADLPLPEAAPRSTGAKLAAELAAEPVSDRNAAAPAASVFEPASDPARARPELRAAEAREQAADLRVALARREFLPDLTLVGAYDGLWQESPLAPFVGVQLNVPLQRGRRRAALEESEALLEAARQRREALEDDLQLALSSARETASRAREAERLVRDRWLPAAHDQIATARAGYAAGTGSFREWLDALRELHEIELVHAESVARVDQSEAELEHALGLIPGRRGERR